MKTFKAAFNKALREVGFKPSKSLVDRRTNQTAKLYKSPSGDRYNLQEAVVAAVRRGDGKE